MFLGNLVKQFSHILDVFAQLLLQKTRGLYFLVHVTVLCNIFVQRWHALKDQSVVLIEVDLDALHVSLEIVFGIGVGG